MKNYYRKFIGIDPGKNGGVAVLDFKGDIIETDIFDEDRLVSLLKRNSDGSMAIVEEVHAMPKQGVVSMFHFGENYGFIRGALKALNIEAKKTRPQAWKKHFGLSSDKQESIEKAIAFYPDYDFRKSELARKPHDGICEAVLIARYMLDCTEYELNELKGEEDDYSRTV